VVGAGFAGLRCADILTQRGFDVTIFEARDRIGGRVVQTTLPSGHIVDLGPNWIHGTDHNPILEIAIKTGTMIHEFKDQENFFDEDGKLLKNGRFLSAVMWEMIEHAFKYSRENTDKIRSEASLHEWFNAQVYKRYPKESEFRQRKILLQMIHFWGAFVASKVETQSLKFLWMEEVIEGGKYSNPYPNLFCARLRNSHDTSA
jgi:monoamine oxidase